mgnify:CR=1 FL=1
MQRLQVPAFYQWLSGTVALLEFFLAAAWAWIISPDILQRVAHRILMVVIAVRSMNMFMLMVVRMVAVRSEERRVGKE